MVERRIVRSLVARERVVSEEQREAAMDHAPLAPVERAYLADRHPQSLAGILAAKRSVACLLSELQPGRPVLPDSVVIDHEAAGAPVISSVPHGSAEGVRLFVSISHTAGWALALAAAESEAAS